MKVGIKFCFKNINVVFKIIKLKGTLKTIYLSCLAFVYNKCTLAINHNKPKPQIDLKRIAYICQVNRIFIRFYPGYCQIVNYQYINQQIT
mgnify:CR=1 FL=1